MITHVEFHIARHSPPKPGRDLRDAMKIPVHAKGGFSAPKVLDTGWGQYNMIVAAGDGVLYARNSTTGDLFRFHWHPESDRLYQYALKVGTNWKSMTRLQSCSNHLFRAWHFREYDGLG